MHNLEFLSEYGLFLAKTVTLLLALIVVIVVMVGVGQKQRRGDRGHIEVRSLNDVIEGVGQTLKQAVLNPEALKQELKDEKKRHKLLTKDQKKAVKTGEVSRQRIFVLDFDGDVQASGVDQLREEITAVLSIATSSDEVVLRLESPGGMVHSYGLAASQLSRITSKGIRLTIAVDKVAASGGYMMACIAHKIIAAPFALLGSIGVVAQIPNFNRLLKSKDIDVEVLTAGEHKRTLTMFGENTEKGRQKFLEELEDVHTLFKDFISEHRPQVNMTEVATGEAWYGRRALTHQLVDELKTSDEYIVDKCLTNDVFQVRYIEDRSRVDQVMERFTALLTRVKSAELLRINEPFRF
ncbi:MAG: serine protease SohB [Candidatus Azotimanducaceae bacterium]|jgi:serine protease SohB